MFLWIKTSVIYIFDRSSLTQVFQMVVYFLSIFVMIPEIATFLFSETIPFTRSTIDFATFSVFFFGIKFVGPDMHDYMVWSLVSYARVYIIFYTSNFSTWETSNINAMLERPIHDSSHLLVCFIISPSIKNRPKLLHFVYLFWVQVSL